MSCNNNSITFTDEQLSYMEDTHDFVHGARCYELELPWMDADAIHWLNTHLQSTYTCLEFGSGGSTLFFNKLVDVIDTYEADMKWYELLSSKHCNDKINYHYTASQDDLVSKISNLPKAYYDVCIVDIGTSLAGRNREELFLKSVPNMKRTTIYVLDNGFSQHHYFNIYKWTLADFKKVLGNHYAMVDFNKAPFNPYAGTRILYPLNDLGDITTNY